MNYQQKNLSACCQSQPSEPPNSLLPTGVPRESTSPALQPGSFFRSCRPGQRRCRSPGPAEHLSHDRSHSKGSSAPERARQERRLIGGTPGHAVTSTCRDGDRVSGGVHLLGALQSYGAMSRHGGARPPQNINAMDVFDAVGALVRPHGMACKLAHRLSNRSQARRGQGQRAARDRAGVSLAA
jgi:hypothetical protein